MGTISPAVLVALLLVAGLCEPSTFDAFAGAARPSTSAERLHPKYRLPARCFAYVGDEADTKTWKLPYLLADGRPDSQRLPLAIQAVMTSYRGKKVSGIPDDQIPDVLARLAKAAARAGKMPFQNQKAAAIYHQLENAIDTFGRLDEIKAETSPKPGESS